MNITYDKYNPIIGIEVHVELNTKSKMFCRCFASYFGSKPNTNTCPVCLGLPGALPYANKKAIDYCVMIALAFNCKINEYSYFERKNYFYPDLSKGYQISQYKKPFGYDGYININVKNETKRIRIRRVHMEEDTAKLIHRLESQNANVKSQNGGTLIDFNRSGVPLVEIVTEPDIESGNQAKIYLTQLQKIIRYLGVSEADMEKGAMRLEPNISLIKSEIRNPKSDIKLPNYKVEVKNINSFRFVEKAINYEIDRQKIILERGEIPKQETRGWNEIKGQTVSQRSKEEAHDYRYFPEPDLPPIRFVESQISNLKSQMPELPHKKLERFKLEYNLSDYDAQIITREKNMADYYEECVKVGKEFEINPKQIADYIINKKVNIDEVLPARLIQRIKASIKVVLIDQDELKKIIDLVITENQKAVDDYKAGKEASIMFLVGQVMRRFKEKIDAKVVTELIKNKL